MLGVMQVSSTQYIVINNGSTGYTGYGADFQWGTVKITALSSLSGSPKPYMHYGDNPQRPILQLLVRPDDDDRFPGQLQPLVLRATATMPRAIAGGRAPATSRRCMPASWASRRP